MNAQTRKNRQKRNEGDPVGRELPASQQSLRAGFTYLDVEGEALERLARKGFDWAELLRTTGEARSHSRIDPDEGDPVDERQLVGCA